MKTIFLFILGIFVLYFTGPFFGQTRQWEKNARLEEIKQLDLNSLCAGTFRCAPHEISEQEKEERVLIQGFMSYF